MPVAEQLAKDGLTYTRFHTTALCSPTRQSLLTGRNPHSVNMGGVTEIATGFPGYTSVRPDSAVKIAQILNLAPRSGERRPRGKARAVWISRSREVDPVAGHLLSQLPICRGQFQSYWSR